jgi:hypothetical protein
MACIRCILYACIHVCSDGVTVYTCVYAAAQMDGDGCMHVYVYTDGMVMVLMSIYVCMYVYIDGW